jgi:hypothetical protein
MRFASAAASMERQVPMGAQVAVADRTKVMEVIGSGLWHGFK